MYITGVWKNLTERNKLRQKDFLAWRKTNGIM